MAEDFNFVYFDNGYQFYDPVRVFFGPGMLELLSKIKLPGKKAFIGVTWERFYVDRVCKLLDENGVDYFVYDKINPNPLSDDVDEAARVAKEQGCDFTMSIGGGSSTDVCKCVAVLLRNEGKIWDYIGDDIDGVRVAKRQAKEAAPIMVISTTAGTGSEVNQSAVVVNSETHVKSDLSKDYCFPTMTIVDPELHLTLPPSLTASQGMDLVFHIIEGLLTVGCEQNLYARILGKTALELAAKNLPLAYNEPGNIEARTAMALACKLSGYVETMLFLKSLHGIGMAFNGFSTGIPHGLSMCIVSIECFKKYVKEQPERCAMMSEWVGYGNRPEGILEWLIDIQKQINMYNIDYRRFGLDINRAEEYATAAVNAGNGLFDYDVNRLTIEETAQIIRDAFARCESDR